MVARTTSLHQLDETSLPFNVQERNAMIIEINDEKFYIIFAQHFTLSKNIEYDHTTQY